MKRILWAFLAAAAVWGVGCSNGTPGGPGADTDKDKDKGSAVQRAEDAVIQHEGTFSLTLPLLATRLKQGEAKEVTVGIRRGKNFDEDVAVKFEGAPQGVTVDPSSATIKHDQKDAKVIVKAADDAALGDFTINVTGHAAKGADATNKLKVTVEKK